MQNKKGFIGLIAILIVVAVAAIWMVYLFKNDWFGGGINVPSMSGEEQDTTRTPKDASQQLDDLRQDVRSLEEKKNQEIIDELYK